jgi:hypothetical protein
MEVLLLAVMGISNIICFLIGAKVGKMSGKNEVVVMSTANPLKAVRDRESKKEAAREQERINTILENIEGYDGTPMGQKDVPGR